MVKKYEYSLAGCLTNMVSDIDGKELNLGWNSKYQLSTVDVAGGTNVSYDYNVLGQRVARIEIMAGVTNTEYYIHDGVNIVADLDEDKELLRSYTYAPGYDNIISMTTHGDSETNTYFYIRNHNNSVMALIDETGNTVESYTYTAYGEVTVFDSNGNELDESALGNRYTFQGREIDWSTGLYNFRARWYDAETGRWLSKDPIGINGGLNQYVFCGNNPVMFGDPSGRDFFSMDPEQGALYNCSVNTPTLGPPPSGDTYGPVYWLYYSKYTGEIYGWPYAHVLASAGITQSSGKTVAWCCGVAKECLDLTKGICGNDDSLYSAFQPIDKEMNEIGRSIPPGVSPEEWAEPYKTVGEGPPGPFYPDDRIPKDGCLND
jgi:RHS repeat-associated protein